MGHSGLIIGYEMYITNVKDLWPLPQTTYLAELKSSESLEDRTISQRPHEQSSYSGTASHPSLESRRTGPPADRQLAASGDVRVDVGLYFIEVIFTVSFLFRRSHGTASYISRGLVKLQRGQSTVSNHRADESPSKGKSCKIQSHCDIGS